MLRQNSNSVAIEVALSKDLNDNISLTTNSDGGNRTEVNGAQYAVNASVPSYLDLTATDFTQNYVSLFAAPRPAEMPYSSTLTASDLTFSCIACSTNSLPTAFEGQATTNGNYSFAGMLLNDFAGTIGVTGQPPVEFTELNNGIIAINSSILVQNTTFTSVKQHDNTYTMPLTAINGTGIFVGADIGKFASLIQKGFGISTSFEDVSFGIHTFRASQYVSHNTMEEMQIGIISAETNALTTEITNNDIEAEVCGIWLKNSLEANHTSVDKNTISTWGNPTGFNFGGIIMEDIGETVSPDASQCYITCNEISGHFLYGIHVNGSHHSYFYRNAVSINSSNMCTGFNFVNTKQPLLDNNTVIGTSTSWGTGYNFSECYGAAITNNYSSTTAKGFNFQSNNTNTFYQNNYSLLHQVGLYLEFGANIGPQFLVDNGQFYVFNNNWLADVNNVSQYTSTGGFGAINDDDSPFGSLNNQFLYSNSFGVGSVKCPHFDGHQDWFVPITSSNITPNISNTCNILPPDPPDPTDPTIHDRMIAHDSIVTEHFHPETAIMAAGDLWDKLDANESLRNSEEYFSDFYDLYENENLGLQSKVRSAMKLINQDDNENEDEIALNDSLIKALLLKKSFNDSLIFDGELTHVDSLSYLDSNSSILAEVNSLIHQNNEMLTLFEDSKVDKIETAWDMNDEISPSTTMETNKKQTNDIYLRYIAAGDFNLEEEDIEILEEIADQCPFSGGRAVYQARAILDIIGGFSEYDDETVCTEDENYRKANKNKKSNYEVTVYPNPLKESCRFIYALPKDENAQLIILDCVGQVIYESDLPINSTSYNLKLKRLSEGVYFYSINAKSGPIGNGKLILIK